MARRSRILFQEKQIFRRPGVWGLLSILPAGFSLLLIWQVALGHSVGERPLSTANVVGWTLFLWLIYFRLITLKMVTNVQPGTLSVSIHGLWTLREMALDEIGKVEIVTYDPVAEYGGYGIRLTKHGRAYIASGGRGVRLTSIKGGKVLVGSQRPGDLARAIAEAGPADSG